MQHDLFGSRHDLDLRSNFQLIYHSTRLDTRNTMLTKNLCPLLNQKLLQNKFNRKKLLLLEFLLSAGQTVDLRSKLRQVRKRTLKGLSNELSRSTVALLIPELCASLSKNVEIGQI